MTSLKSVFSFVTGLIKASISHSASAYKGENMGSE